MRALVARWPSWWPAALAVAVTSPLALYWWQLIAAGSIAFDWNIFVEAGRRVVAGSPDLYEQGAVYGFLHSPIFAYIISMVAWIGTGGIRLLTLASALAMPTWPMRLLAIGSWPFAMDLQHGALLTVIVCVAAWAVRGSMVAGMAFVVMALFSPRALMLPIVLFVLWKNPRLRLPAMGIAVVHSLAVVATGYADDWLSVLLTTGTGQIETLLNLSPSRYLGGWWLLAGVPLAAWLTVRGRIGFAALAISPYVLPHYLLVLLLELNPSKLGTHDDLAQR